MRFETGFPGLVAVLAAVLSASQSRADPGDLDPTFGAGTGMVRDAMGAAGGQGQAVVIDGSGRIVAAGTALPLSPVSGDFGLLRLNPDGSLDSGFGNGGRSIQNAVTFANGSTSIEEGYGLVLQADGRLVMAGSSFISSTGNDFAALRLNTDGNVDTSFGNNGNGWMTTARPDTDLALAATGDGAGGLLLGGYVADGGDINAAGLRLDSLGMPDPFFGSSGFVVGTDDSNAFYAVAAQSDGKVVFGGAADAGGGALREIDGGAGTAIVQRFNADGSVDSGFAGDGRAELTGVLDRVGDLRVLADGRILVGGFRSTNASIVRLYASGAIDASFGVGGALTLSASNLGLGQMFLQSIAMDSDARIIACGHAGSAIGSQIFVLRSTFDGQPDAGFASNGVRLLDAAGNLNGNAVAVQADGAIVIAGSDRGTSSTSDDQYLIVRLQGGPNACDRIFAHDFDGSEAQVCPTP